MKIAKLIKAVISNPSLSLCSRVSRNQGSEDARAKEAPAKLDHEEEESRKAIVKSNGGVNQHKIDRAQESPRQLDGAAKVSVNG